MSGHVPAAHELHEVVAIIYDHISEQSYVFLVILQDTRGLSKTAQSFHFDITGQSLGITPALNRSVLAIKDAVSEV